MPAAITISQAGYQVRGYDINPLCMSLDGLPAYELDADRRGPLSATLSGDSSFGFAGLADVVNETSCVFVAVETPHEPRYEGVTPLPQTRADFSYDALTAAVRAIVSVARHPVEIGVISTVLPGTVRRLLLPLMGPHTLVYCPQFVAMGTVAYDLRHPEFTLLGYGESKPSVVKEVLEEVRAEPVPTFEVAYESAELAKVCYNTFIAAKVTVANTAQQMAQLCGASAAEVFGVLRAAGQRLASPRYIGPGMGDGGPCHPRDNIALSWLAREKNLGADLFTAIMEQRQAYIEWLADEFTAAAGGRPMVLLGTAYKPGLPLETGSSSVLLANVLAARGVPVTIVRFPGELAAAALGDTPAAFFLGCPAGDFLTMRFPEGSVVIDPWHLVKPSDGVELRRVGERW